MGAQEVNVVVASQESGNVWYIVRPDGDATPIPPFKIPSEWQMLPTGTSTIHLAESSTVHVQLDKQNYNTPPVVKAHYIISNPVVVTYAQATAPNLLWLLLLLLIVPIAGAIIAAIVYIRKQRRKKIERETFATLGFNLNE
jgi:hypothetical protein